MEVIGKSLALFIWQIIGKNLKNLIGENGMKKNIFGRILILIFIVFFGCFSSENSAAESDISQTDKNSSSDEIPIGQDDSLIAEIRTILEKNYIEPERLKKINWNLIDKMEEKKGIKEIFSNLDLHSYYMEADILEMKYKSNGKEYAGIGVELEQIWSDEFFARQMIIIEVYQGGPADKAGLLPGDILIKINDKNINEYRLPGIVKEIEGEKGSSLKITVLREGKEIIFKMVRDIVKIDLVASLMFEDKQLKIGYLKIKNFNVYGIANNLMEKIIGLAEKGANKFILDLRGNPGGLFDEAINVADIFLSNTNFKKQLIITVVKNKNNNIIFMPYSVNKVNIISSLIVLVDAESASVSEIVASALQNHKAAIVIGVPTFGKASIQRLFPLKNGGAVMITTMRCFQTNGETLQGYGVMPDITIQKNEAKEQEEITREKDLKGTLKPIGEAPAIPFSEIPEKYKNDFQLMKTLEIIRSFEILKNEKNKN